MKKIRLSVANLVGTEILSRVQLKSIFGGTGSSIIGSGSSVTLPEMCTVGVTCWDIGPYITCGGLVCDYIYNTTFMSQKPKIGIMCDNVVKMCPAIQGGIPL